MLIRKIKNYKKRVINMKIEDEKKFEEEKYKMLNKILKELQLIKKVLKSDQ